MLLMMARRAMAAHGNLPLVCSVVFGAVAGTGAALTPFGSTLAVPLPHPSATPSPACGLRGQAAEIKAKQPKAKGQ